MRVLFLTHRVPYPPNRGDRVRAFHIVRTLTAASVDVEIVSLAHDAEEQHQAAALERLLSVRVSAVRTAPVLNHLHAAIALLGSRPLTHCLLDSPAIGGTLDSIVATRPPDVVLALCSGMARFAFEPPLNRYPSVIDFVDVDSAKWTALAATTRPPKRWIYRRESEYLGRFEAWAAQHATANVVVNERERDALARLAPESSIHVIENGVDLDVLRPPGPPVEAPRVVFCGVMDYEPNVQGVLWFAREVWPLLRAQRPDAHLTIVGANPTEAVRRLSSVQVGIEVTGTVADVREYLWRSAVSIAPLLTGRGVQNKVLEAVAAGLPTVVTRNVMRGLPADVQAACRVADSPQAFADEVVSLLAMSGAQNRAIATRARLDSMTWEGQLCPLRALLQDVSAQR